VEEQKLGLIDLHPDVFGTQPRIDIIHENIEWQMKYRKVVCNPAIVSVNLHEISVYLVQICFFFQGVLIQIIFIR
jgi:hypothetical protein